MFIVMSEKHSVHVHFPRPASLATDNKKQMYITMKMNHFSMNIIQATTGHKLQGKLLDQLFISSCSKTDHMYYSQEHGPSMGKGSKDYLVPGELVNMMNVFQTTK
jgi:hypothetical protein